MTAEFVGAAPPIYVVTECDGLVNVATTQEASLTEIVKATVLSVITPEYSTEVMVRSKL